MEGNNRFKIIGFDVDTQRGFMETVETTGYQGKLALLDNEGNPKGAMEIAPQLKKITKYLRDNNIPIFGSVDWHNKNSKEFDDKNPDFRTTFPSHCIRGTYDAQNIDATRKINPLYIDWDKEYVLEELIRIVNNHDGEIIFRKDSFNVFKENPEESEGVGNPYARRLMENLGVEKVIVYGVATDVCVNYVVEEFKKLGVNVYAVEDAMQGVTPKNHEETISKWKSKGINVINLEGILRENVK